MLRGRGSRRGVSVGTGREVDRAKNEGRRWRIRMAGDSVGEGMYREETSNE